MEFLFLDFFNGRCKYIYNMRELMCRMKEQGKQALNGTLFVQIGIALIEGQENLYEVAISHRPASSFTLF